MRVARGLALAALLLTAQGCTPNDSSLKAAPLTADPTAGLTAGPAGLPERDRPLAETTEDDGARDLLIDVAGRGDLRARPTGGGGRATALASG